MRDDHTCDVCGLPVAFMYAVPQVGAVLGGRVNPISMYVVNTSTSKLMICTCN